jgi:hypothetical protein
MRRECSASPPRRLDAVRAPTETAAVLANHYVAPFRLLLRLLQVPDSLGASVSSVTCSGCGMAIKQPFLEFGPADQPHAITATEVTRRLSNPQLIEDRCSASPTDSCGSVARHDDDVDTSLTVDRGKIKGAGRSPALSRPCPSSVRSCSSCG